MSGHGEPFMLAISVETARAEARKYAPAPWSWWAEQPRERFTAFAYSQVPRMNNGRAAKLVEQLRAEALKQLVLERNPQARARD